MPAKKRISREDIIEVAFTLVRENSCDALSARSVASALGCSTQPIFSCFEGMDALYEAVIARAWQFWLDRTAADMAAGRWPPYKASGMSYITFAAEEPSLFRLLFMRDRKTDLQTNETEHPPNVIRALTEQTGMSEEAARRFHTEMWVFVHGLAVLAATGFTAIDEDAASGMLSDVYSGLIMQYQQKGEIKRD